MFVCVCRPRVGECANDDGDAASRQRRRRRSLEIYINPSAKLHHSLYHDDSSLLPFWRSQSHKLALRAQPPTTVVAIFIGDTSNIPHSHHRMNINFNPLSTVAQPLCSVRSATNNTVERPKRNGELIRKTRTLYSRSAISRPTSAKPGRGCYRAGHNDSTHTKKMCIPVSA